MKKAIPLILMSFLFFGVPVFVRAQMADRMDLLLDSPAVSYETAAGFVLEAAEISAPNAFTYAMEQGWLPSKASPEGTAAMDGVSLLIMRAFRMKGGFMYTLTHSPRYAYHELVYKKVIQGKAGPSLAVSGEQLLYMVGFVLSEYPVEGAGAPQALAGESDAQRLLVEEISAQLAAMNMKDSSVQAGEEGVTISLFNVQFAADSAELTASEKAKIEEIGRILKQISRRKILVSGHTTLAGTPEMRMAVSRDRARSVADYLVTLGVRRADEITIQGYGGDRPVADNSTPAGQARNRRVEITILNEGAQ